MIPIFRLTNEPGGSGLRCAPDGLSLAGVPLLYKTEAGFAPRSTSEIASLLKAGYDDQEQPARLQASLGAIADALNGGDIARAATIAVLTRTPELSDEAALRLVEADAELAKYNFDPAQPRDWHGRWTTEGGSGSVNITAPVDLSAASRETDLISPRAEADHSDGARYASAASDDSSESPREPGNDDDHSQEPTSPRQKFEQKYDALGPVEFSKEVIEFGYRLATSGPYFSAAEKEQALAEYSFLQERLSASLASDTIPARVHGYLLSAAMFLYQGGIAAEIAQAHHVPESMADVAGGVLAFESSPQTRSRAIEPDVPIAPSAAYTSKIKWGIQEIDVRPEGPGFWGQRVPQSDPAVDAYELQINPNNESYYLPSPDGGYVQFENFAGNTLQDAKLVKRLSSFYMVADMPLFAEASVLPAATRQVKAASAHGLNVEWLVSNQKAVDQLNALFRRQPEPIPITVTYRPAKMSIEKMLTSEQDLAFKSTQFESIFEAKEYKHLRNLAPDVKRALGFHFLFGDGEMRRRAGFHWMSRAQAFYNSYYWFLVFTKLHEERYGFDAGLEQQCLQMLEQAPSDVDWTVTKEVMEAANREYHRYARGPSEST
jgi:hypothetical protein